MTDPTILTTCAVSLVSLAWLWFVPLASLRRDNYRADIRRLRDGLFDYMYRNDCDYSIPAYVETRKMLNGLLRLSNKVNILNFTVAYICVKDVDGPGITRTRGSLQKEIDRVRREAIKRTLHFIFLEGTTAIYTRTLILVLRILGKDNQHERRMKKRAKILIAEAREYGEPNLTWEQRSILGV